MLDQTVAQIRGRLLPPPEKPAQCHRCNGRVEEYTVKSKNRNGNAGRPYYKCIGACRKKTFLVFADSRGNFPENPDCLCRTSGTSSKMQLANEKENSRKVHLVCRRGRCNYFGLILNQYGEPLALENSEWVREFYEHRLI